MVKALQGQGNTPKILMGLLEPRKLMQESNNLTLKISIFSFTRPLFIGLHIKKYKPIGI